MPIISHKLTPLMQVFDMRRSVAWYRDIIGFEVLQTHEPDGHLHWVLLKLGDAMLMLNSKYEDDVQLETRSVRVEGHSDLTLYFDCPNVDEAYEHLLAEGCDVAAPVTRFYGMKQVTVADPDGYELCFQQSVK
jgi:glyoxylase I family protein